MAEFSIREAVELAVQTEKIGAGFYRTMADKYKDNKELHDFFSELSGKEEIHEKRFSELKAQLSDEEPDEWLLVADYMRAMVESAFFLGKEKSTAHMQNINDLRAAIGYAIGFEKETLLFYYGIRDAMRDSKILNEIIEEERSHIKWLNGFRNR